MKTLKQLIGFAVISSLAVIQAHAQPVPTNGLVAYYPFNGNFNDLSGDGNSGTGSGVTPTSDRLGISASAYQFNGSTGVVTVASLSSLNLTEITVSAWVKLNTAPADAGMVVSKWRAYSYSLEDYSMAIMSDLRVNFGNGRHGNGYFDLPNHCTVYTTNSLSLGDWHYIVGTLDSAGTGRIWIDGTLAGQDFILTLLPPATEPVRFGQMLVYNGAVSYPFNGAMDDIRIYNRALSAPEVLQLYQHDTSCVPHRATATATIAGGVVTGISITEPGCGYNSPPLVLIQGRGGNGATATAEIGNGVVTNILIANGGAGYTSAPDVYIYSPTGLAVSLLKAVKPVFSDLSIGANYQLQVSTDFNNWINTGSPFTATNPLMICPQYWDVDSCQQLYFRLQQSP